VKVSGKVIGAPPGAGLTLYGTSTSGLDAAINPDGSFEIQLLPGTYQARFTPVLPIPPVSLVVPPNKDIADVRIVFPPLVELKGRVEGVGARFLLFNVTSPLAPRIGVAAYAQADGSFSLTLPEGERGLTLTVDGFSVKSMTYGATDLLKDSFIVRAGSSEELGVTLVPAR
jgi:hypothetical protein